MSVLEAKTERQNSDSFAETELVEALRNYDENAFRTLIDQYQATMVQMALRYVDDAETAKDVVQETWLAVLRGVYKFAGRASFKTWLLTILINRARTRGKQAKRLIATGEIRGQSTWEQGDEGETGSWADRCDKAAGRSTGMLQAASVMKTPEETMLHQEAQTYLERAILALPTAQREVMILRDIEGWSAEEVCLFLGLSEGNQRVLLHRARIKVRHALERYFCDER